MKRIVILGGGESGVGSAVLAKKKGFDVFLSDAGSIKERYRNMLDQHGIQYETKNHTISLILNADLVIKSPGIADELPIIQNIIKKGIPIISEIEFAGRYDKSLKICVTGSNGKTTTATLIHYMLIKAGMNATLAGNVGESYAYQVATSEFDICVLELSSFQLDGMYDFKADIAVLLNITPDHLDRYGNQMQRYINSKFRITSNMSKEDCFIFCADDEVTMKHIESIVLRARLLPITQKEIKSEGAFLERDNMVVRYDGSQWDMPIEDLSLKGKHNVYNSMAAAIAGKVMKITNSVIRESLMTFKGVEHRLEKVLSIKGVLYINDSKATNINSAWYALESMESPVIWIAGGTDKGNDYSVLNDLVRKKVKALICLGVDNKKLHDAFEGIVETITDTTSAQDAVKKAYELAEPGDVVLLSPACASFDLFNNYEDRGNQFKEAVKML